MCYKPIKIYNNSHSLRQFISQPLFYSVPCGECYQCQQYKSNEYYARSYYESLSTFRNGGYIIYDTLTYSPRYVPRAKSVLSDILDTSQIANFMVFNRQDFVNFMKRLRKRLHSDGYDYRNIKYFCVGEYGSSEHHTHRPHLHVLFYVQNPSIPPLYLSRSINSCWSLGRTDGVDYRGEQYFWQNSYIANNSSSLLSTIYITKYVEKDCAFQSVLNRRLKYLDKVLLSQRPDGYSSSYEYRLESQRIKRSINQFQINSQHFGEYIIEYYGVDKLVLDDKVSFPSAQNAVKTLPLPRYISRKLFYDYDKVNHCYNLNDLGIKYRIKKNSAFVDSLSYKFDNYRFMPDYDSDFLSSHPYDSRKLSEYLLFFRGRLRGIERYTPQRVNELQYYQPDCDNIVLLNTMRDSYDNCGRFVCCDGSLVPTRDFVSKNCFFNPNYEYILKYFSKLDSSLGIRQQESYCLQQSLKKRLKVVNALR